MTIAYKVYLKYELKRAREAWHKFAMQVDDFQRLIRASEQEIRQGGDPGAVERLQNWRELLAAAEKREKIASEKYSELLDIEGLLPPKNPYSEEEEII